ncbi:transcriptional regulator [Maritimibacter sp. 55A14]|nr:transcriptional regulator [Maritimibacter sp. 55A14]
MPGHLIRRLNQISTSVFQDRMRAHGWDMTAVQFAALRAVERHPGLDQASLAGLIAYDRATIGGVTDRLAAKGLVRRAVSASDRRARALTLTPAGRALLAAAAPVVEELQDEILVGLDPAERAEFLRLAAKAADRGNALSRAPLVLPPGDTAGQR